MLTVASLSRHLHILTHYQIITGAGMGFALQQPAIAVQTVLSESDSTVGLSILSFLGFLSGTVFITVAQTLLQGQLDSRIKQHFPDIDTQQLSNSGAASIRNLVSDDKMDLVLNVYNDSMRSIWYLALAMGAASLVVSFAFEWKNVKANKKKEEAKEESAGSVSA
jgi:hypothetical protein